ncbi:hypothetical protein JVU11DRAFT_3489 [Chiua virens]|nr:hypothetical protein JVU11DRAFT_3489 [Chiua virens]
MECDTVPPYTPSPPSPGYSSELLPGEQTVEFTRRVSSRPPCGVYRRITDLLTIILREQHPDSMYPIYGRGGVIQGDVILGDTPVDNITSLTLKLEGHLVLHASGAPISTMFLSKSHVLWNAAHGHCCPRVIPFGVAVPLTFNDGGHARALPPTFESGEPQVACSYSLSIELSRPRQFLSFLKGNEAIKVPILYRPRSRPQLPMLPTDLPFMSTVKTSPEEWHEAMCTVPMTKGSGLAQIECLLFIPSVQIYALSDTIPFHLQIRGSSASLVPFLEQSQVGQQNGGVTIRVYLLRQMIAKVHGQSAAACITLGEGKMEPSQSLPSSHHAFLRHPLNEGLDSLDWDGVLRCGEDVTVPGFSTSQISVKDSIVLSIAPRQPLKSPVLGVKHSIPIRLATDPWSNDTVV